MSKTQVQAIEKNIELSKQFIELDKALERLEANKDFLKVIKEGYLEKEAIRLVHLKADPAMQTPDRQLSISKSIDGIGNLLDYFRTVSFTAAQALKAIEADEFERDELLAEES